MKNNTLPSWKGVFYKIDKQNINIQNIKNANNLWISKIKKELTKIQDYNKFDFLQYRFTNINIIFSIFKINSILDVGGSNGWCYYFLKKYSIKRVIKKYTILETEYVSKIMQKIGFLKKVKYEFNLNKIKKHDLLYSNSTFQYILDDVDIKDIILKSNPKYILLEDLIIGDFKDYYTNQIYYDQYITVKFRNENFFLNFLKSLNYDIIYLENYISKHRGQFQMLPMKGFSNKNKLQYSKSVFLKKKL